MSNSAILAKLNASSDAALVDLFGHNLNAPEPQACEPSSQPPDGSTTQTDPPRIVAFSSHDLAEFEHRERRESPHGAYAGSGLGRKDRLGAWPSLFPNTTASTKATKLLVTGSVRSRTQTAGQDLVEPSPYEAGD